MGLPVLSEANIAFSDHRCGWQETGLKATILAAPEIGADRQCTPGMRERAE
jgi:hypothetical protein